MEKDLSVKLEAFKPLDENQKGERICGTERQILELDRKYEKERSGVSVTQYRIDAVEEFAGKEK